MSYQVIARRWRPQTYNEIVYQDHVSRTLQNSIKSGRISHAYIFSGPRGVGKTTTARVLAKSINCIHGPTPEPCGECENCREITDGTSFDVIEIDGASNNGVDNIRELCEKVNFAPVKSNYKVYVIDEVHMLSGSAFNALLKTLEEPPPHAVFILATTEEHKIPETILSRCQKYRFRRISAAGIVRQLSRIVEKENRTLAEHELYSIARIAGGSMRDAQSLLEQVLSFPEGEDLFELIGIVPVQSFIKILTSVNRSDAAAVIEECGRISSTGINIPRYVEAFKDIIRAMRLALLKVPFAEMAGYSQEEAEEITACSSDFNDEELSRFFILLQQLAHDLRFTDTESINLEMTILDMLSLHSAPTLASLIENIEKASHGSITAEKKNSTRIIRTELPAADAEPQQTGPDLEGTWKNILTRTSMIKDYLAHKLSGCTYTYSDTLVIITTGEDTPRIEERELEWLNEQLVEVLPQGKVRLASAAQQESMKTDPAGPRPPLPEQQTKTEIDAEIEVPPIVKKVMDMFHGEIVTREGE